MAESNLPGDPGPATQEPMESQLRDAVSGAASMWWLFLVAGFLWAVVAFVVLQFSTTSLVTVGYIIGAMLLFAGVEQFLVASAAGGMKWVFWIFGALFVVVGAVSMFNPLDTVASVAGALGMIFALIGVFWAIEAFFARSVNPLWWLALLSGVVMVGLGIWLGTQDFQEKVVTLLVFAGFWSLLHAVTDVLRGFQLRRAGRLIAASKG